MGNAIYVAHLPDIFDAQVGQGISVENAVSTWKLTPANEIFSRFSTNVNSSNCQAYHAGPTCAP